MLKLFFILGLLSLTAGNLLHIPIFKNELVLTTENFQNESQKLLERYSENTKVEGMGTVIKGFYGYIGIGTPVQTLKVSFDTGLQHFWVYTSKACAGYSCTGYNANVSSTFVEYAEEYDYSVGYVEEDIENIQIAGSAISSIAFEQIDTVSSDDYDGVFGLGYQTNVFHYTEYGPIEFAPFYYLLQQGVISEPIYSLYLQNTKTSYGGEIIFGGSDDTLYSGELTYLTSNSTSEWLFTLDEAVLGGKVLSSYTQVAIDSSTPLIGVPIKVLIEIAIQFGAILQGDGTSSIPCSSVPSLPDVQLTVGGVEVTLTPSDYIYNLQSANGDVICQNAFAYSGDENWVLGLAFLRKVYAEFNLKTNVMGIAPSVAAPADATAPSGLPPITQPAKKPCITTLNAFMRKFQKAKFSN